MCGAHSSRGDFFQRDWSQEELDCDPHINVLEVRAAREGLVNLASAGDRVRLYVDSTAALYYIKKQGGTRSRALAMEALALWEASETCQVDLLPPQWISTHENVGADFLTRNRMQHWELMLRRDLFRQIVDHFQVFPSLDAFASRITAQMPRYMSWFPDPLAIAQDTMLAQWDAVTYLFPPVPMLPKVLQKIKLEGIKAILICPRWPSSMWWTLATDMLVEPPLSLPHSHSALENLTGKSIQCYLDPLVAMVVSGATTGSH